MKISFDQLLKLVDGQSESRVDIPLVGAASLEEAAAGDISFFGNPKYLPALKLTNASVVLVPKSFDIDVPNPTLVRVENPSAAFNEVLKQFRVTRRALPPGIHSTASVDPTAQLDPDKVAVGPGASIGPNCVVGDGTEIGPGVTIGDHVVVGANCLLHARCTICHGCKLGDRVILHSGSVVGSDGFGYELVDGRQQKMDQLGIVELKSDVEIGANSTIDRARFGRTVVGEGTKIDNLVQIGHNCRIGKHCVIVALTGIAGSARIGDNVTIAAQSGVAGHLEIGDGAILAARTGVTKSIEGGQVYMGYPVVPMREGRKAMAVLRHIHRLVGRVRALEKKSGLE